MANPPTPEQRGQHVETIRKRITDQFFWYDTDALAELRDLLAEIDRLIGELDAANKHVEIVEARCEEHGRTIADRTRERDEAKAQLDALRPGEGDGLLRVVVGQPLHGNNSWIAIGLRLPNADTHWICWAPRSALVQFPPAPASCADGGSEAAPPSAQEEQDAGGAKGGSGG